MHPLQTIFKKVFYINLDKRTDRRLHVENELSRIGLEAERFPAVDPQGKFGGYEGCLRSHLAIMQMALDQKLGNILIIEDDCVFSDNFNKVCGPVVTDLANVSRWDLLFFYHNACCGRDKTKVITQNLRYIEGTLMTHLYGIKWESIPKVMKILKDSPQHEPIDRIYMENSLELDVLATTEHLASQIAGFSDTIGGIKGEQKISFCTASKGRLWQLSQTIEQNIQDNQTYKNAEFVIVNYDSPDEIDEWVKAHLMEHINRGTVSYYKLLDKRPWNVSHAKNVAHRLASGEILCNLDGDNFTGRGFASFINIEMRRHSQAVGHIFAQGLRGLYGRIFLTKKLFEELGGYDESFMPMAYQDVDLLERSKIYGAKVIEYNTKIEFMRTIANNEASKVQFCEGRAFSEMEAHNMKISKSNIQKRIFRVNIKGWGNCKVQKNFSEIIELR